MTGSIKQQAQDYMSQHSTEGEWAEQTEKKREELLRVHVLDCHQHLRNIVLSHMSQKQAQRVREELQVELQQFAA